MMLLNFSDKGLCKYAFIIYNFSEVSDSALLVLFSDEHHQSTKIILNYVNGRWYFEDNPGYLSAENFHQINAMLKDITKKSRGKEHVRLKASEPCADYVLLLSGLCS